MRIRLLVGVAALVALLPASAHAATIAVTSAQYATPVQLAWDVTGTISQDIYRAPGACAALPMAGAVSIVSEIPPVSTATSDPVTEGTYCYYVRDDTFGAYGNAVTAIVDTAPPSGALTSPALASSATGAITADADDLTSGVHSVAFERSPDGSLWTPISTDLTAPYSANWDTADGNYLVRAVITDEALHTFTTPSAALQVDTTPPQVTMTAPASSSTQHGSVTLHATALDGGTGVTGVSFEARLGSGSWNPIGSGTPSGSDYSLVWDTSALDGSYSVRAIATDGATLATTSAAVTGLLVDNTAPTVSVTSPAPAATLHGASVSVSANAGDGSGSGVTGVSFEYQLVGTGTWSPIGSDSSSPYSASWTLPADGHYNVRAIASDGAAHSTTSGVVGNVLVDNTAPIVSLSSPAAAALLHGASVAVSATADDGAGSGISGVLFEYQLVGAGSWTTIGTDTSNPYVLTWSLPGDGSYNLRATASDAATHATTSTLVTAVVVDNTAPPVPTLGGLTPVSGPPVLTFAPVIDAGSRVEHYELSRDGTLIQSIPDTGAASYSFTDAGAAATTPPTSYHYTLTAVDEAGNVSAPSAQRVILLDATGTSAPTAVTALATPTNQRPQITWVAPALPSFDHYKLYRNSVFLVNLPASQTAFTDSGAAEGTWTYQLRAAIDPSEVTLGVYSAGAAVVYDATPPAAPAGTLASAASDGSIVVSWSAASDSGTGVVRYAVRRAQSSVAPATIADGDAVCQGLVTSCIDTTALNGKLYSYAVFAIDAAGNTSAAGNVPAVTARDQLAPAVPTGLAAAPGDTTVALQWAAASASDDVAGYVLVVKPGGAAPASDSDGTRVCSTLVATSTGCTATGLVNGAAYTFGLFALDEALNRSAAATVTTAPNGPVTDTVAPGSVTKVNAKVSGRAVKLTWKNPADKDFDHVEINASERRPAAHKTTRRVYSGKGSKATITLPRGQSRWFTVVAYDRVGNASAPAAVHVTIAPASPFGPAPRARVHGRVQLQWPVVKGATYYNVQLYAGTRRILVSWPAGHAVRLPKAKLKRGTKYTWYVWPGLGAKAKAHYGKLIGKNLFTYAG